jgi:GntR family transcriptional repressor for pyruvate dehydrogenase complex
MATVRFPRFERETLSQKALEVFLDLIEQGILRAGDRLPPQRELEVQMGVSRTALREAISGLTALGVLDVSVSRGTYVRRVPPEMLLNPAALRFRMEQETLLHSIEVREILEVEAIALAAERANEQDLKGLKDALDRIRKGLHSENPLDNAPDFHVALAKCAHNPVLFSILKSFHGLARRQAAIIAKRVPAAVDREYERHLELYEVVAARLPDQARERMKEHLIEARELILQGAQAEVDEEREAIESDAGRGRRRPRKEPVSLVEFASG